MRQHVAAFVDSASITLALSRDPPLSIEARAHRELLRAVGAKLQTSIPVVIETCTLLERNANRNVVLAEIESIYVRSVVKILPCALRYLEQSWKYFKRPGRHKLSAIDAADFAITRKARISLAFSFDRYFSASGFRLVRCGPDRQ